MEDEDHDQFFNLDQLLMEEGEMQHNGNTRQPQFEEQISNRRKLTLDARRHIVEDILSTLQEDSLPRGAQTKLAARHGVHRSTINRIFADIMKQKQKGELIDVRTKKLGKTGPKSKEYSDELLQSVPLRLRTTERKYVATLKISHVTIHRLKKKGKLRVHTSTNHPALSDNHKVARLQWVLSHLTLATPTTDATFVDMDNVIHIDEKWFYLSLETRKFYLLPKEEDPYRFQQSKSRAGAKPNSTGPHAT